MSELIPLTGEPLALDLVNTHPAVNDLLSTPGELRTWLALQADRFDEARALATAELTPNDLAAVRRVRDHTARVLSHVRCGKRPPADDLNALNHIQRVAPAVTELGWDGETITATRRRIGTPGDQLAAWLAEASVELLADPAVIRVRECEADDCVMLFLPAHPRRRWCSASRCGNRVRVARHYQRHKSA
ncbi:ABATE domain-containing protein [Micromonospora sp. KC721]|uniref:CGNR zinc finger domain-containing protein n=1 Tax=Micromonospora sp. KC721 TaxID=2530380 RepID=UPI00104E04E6|nr:ABATE domain-containing protein [Micromonospora sp. KC721]TDB79089.1 hypothetical protein E1182_13900 [Micromonospora sp. KC721]